MTLPQRVCTHCQVDISQRNYRAIYCEDCSILFKRQTANAGKQRLYEKVKPPPDELGPISYEPTVFRRWRPWERNGE